MTRAERVRGRPRSGPRNPKYSATAVQRVCGSLRGSATPPSCTAARGIQHHTHRHGAEPFVFGTVSFCNIRQPGRGSSPRAGSSNARACRLEISVMS